MNIFVGNWSFRGQSPFSQFLLWWRLKDHDECDEFGDDLDEYDGGYDVEFEDDGDDDDDLPSEEEDVQLAAV